MTEHRLSDQASLMALTPPEFNSCCSFCGLRKRMLSWSAFSEGGTWGLVCPECIKPLLTSFLRLKLPNRFSQAEFVDVMCSLGVSRKEGELVVADFERAGTIALVGTSYCWCEPQPVVKPIFEPKRVHKRVYRKKTGEEIFTACVKLAREIRRREGK